MQVLVIINLFPILFVSYADGESDFYVEKSGNSKVRPGEISVLFYITVANGGKKPIKVFSKNVKCCWIHPRGTDKYDCESMDLLGGIPVTLEPSKTGNITYIFTNLYPLDRVGQCVFHLWHDDHKITHTIRFNTTYMKPTSWLGSLYKTITGEYKEDRVCDTVDLDPRRRCKPVSCVQKYNGKRNFFRKETNLCEPVHECHTELDEDDLPTTAFDKDHNKCKSLIQKELSSKEEKHLKKDAEKNMDASLKGKLRRISPGDPIPVRCNHGKRVGEICVCDDGWKTDTSNVPLGDPKFVYNWCNVRTRKKPLLPYKHQKYCMITGLSLTIFTLLISWIWMLYRYIYQKDGTVKGKAQKVSVKPFLKHRSELVATTELIKELSSKSILKKNREGKATGLISTNTPEALLPAEFNTAELSESAALLGSVADDKSVVSMESKAVQKGKSTVSFARSVSTSSLVNEERSVSLAGRSEQEARRMTSSAGQSPKRFSTYSLAQEGSAVFSEHSTNVNKTSMPSTVNSSKGASTHSLARVVSSTSFSGKPTKDNTTSTSFSEQTTKDRTNDSLQENVSVVSLSGKSMNRGKSSYLSRSPMSTETLTYSLSGKSAASLSKTSATGGRASMLSPSQSSKDTSAFLLAGEASTASFSSKSTKERISSMSSASQALKDPSRYPLADEGKIVSFSHESMQDKRTAVSSSVSHISRECSGVLSVPQTNAVSLSGMLTVDDGAGIRKQLSKGDSTEARTVSVSERLIMQERENFAPEGQPFQENLPYPLASDASTASVTREPTKLNNRIMLSASHSPQDRFAGGKTNSSFVGSGFSQKSKIIPTASSSSDSE